MAGEVRYIVVNPLFKHPSKGWLVVRQQDETKSYAERKAHGFSRGMMKTVAN